MDLVKFMQERGIIGYLFTFLQQVDACLEVSAPHLDQSTIYCIYESLLLLLLEISADGNGSQMLFSAGFINLFIVNSLLDYKSEGIYLYKEYHLTLQTLHLNARIWSP
jgi:hypothetical protein